MIAAALATGAAPAPAPLAAAAPSCQGAPATIVGAPGQRRLTGTDGPDVIVSNGAEAIRALGGDDRVCLTSAPRDGSFFFEAGDGDDRVVLDTNTEAAVVGVLGAGNDFYRGGDDVEQIRGGESGDFAGDGTDTIFTAGGRDVVQVGEAATPVRDIVRLGGGRDELSVSGTPGPGHRFRGGAGRDWLGVTLAPSGDWVIDNRRQVARLNGTSVVSWRAFERFAVSGPRSNTYRFRGSQASERVEIAHLLTASMGAGNDTVVSYPGGAPGVPLFRGGVGIDTLVAWAWARPIRGHVPTGRIDVAKGGSGPERTFTAFEALAFGGTRATLIGGPRADRLHAYGCVTTVEGRGGDDVLESGVIGDDDSFLDCLRSATLLGGPGHDRMLGYDTPDVLRGGPGRDRADGAGGRDLCDAEVRIRCETR